MNTLFDRLKRLFSSGSKHGDSEELLEDVVTVKGPVIETKVTLDDSSLARLMEIIEQTNEEEYFCEETLDLLDEYAELVVQHQDAETIMPLVKGHLEHCVDCNERYEALLRILQEPET